MIRQACFWHRVPMSSCTPRVCSQKWLIWWARGNRSKFWARCPPIMVLDQAYEKLVIERFAPLSLPLGEHFWCAQHQHTGSWEAFALPCFCPSAQKPTLQSGVWLLSADQAFCQSQYWRLFWQRQSKHNVSAVPCPPPIINTLSLNPHWAILLTKLPIKAPLLSFNICAKCQSNAGDPGKICR